MAQHGVYARGGPVLLFPASTKEHSATEMRLKRNRLRSTDIQELLQLNWPIRHFHAECQAQGPPQELKCDSPTTETTGSEVRKEPALRLSPQARLWSLETTMVMLA